jgi:hypothetical protein
MLGVKIEALWKALRKSKPVTDTDIPGVLSV